MPGLPLGVHDEDQTIHYIYARDLSEVRRSETGSGLFPRSARKLPSMNILQSRFRGDAPATSSGTRSARLFPRG